MSAGSGVVRLYLMRVATIVVGDFTMPVPCYLVQTADGKNVLIDTGFPRTDTKEQLIDDPDHGSYSVLHGDLIGQLASIGVKPADIDVLVCTHFHDDHAGNIDAFPNARLVVQRLHYDVAMAGDVRFADCRQQWDQPVSHYQFLDGDTELLPGIELIETSGHVPGHQSVLVHLPETGAVLLAIDAVSFGADFIADRAVEASDDPGLLASTRKLLALVERERVKLVVFGHDGPQWVGLKVVPEFYG